MSPDEQEPGCIGMCNMDWEQEICLGCGRSVAEIYGSDSQPESGEQKEGQDVGSGG